MITAVSIFEAGDYDGSGVCGLGVIDVSGSDVVTIHLKSYANGGLSIQSALEGMAFYDTLGLDSDECEHRQDSG